MVFCFVALGVFGVLGIFSAKYRTYFKEALRCVGQTAILRPCTTGFDKKMQLKISTRAAKYNKALGKVLYKYFTIISWIFVIAMFASLVYGGYGIYNLVVHGSCDPHGGTCIFDETPGLPSCGSQGCLERGCDCDTTGCEAPTFEACEGTCDCKEDICG